MERKEYVRGRQQREAVIGWKPLLRKDLTEVHPGAGTGNEVSVSGAYVIRGMKKVIALLHHEEWNSDKLVSF